MSRDLIAIPALEKSFLYSCGGKKGLVIGIDVSLDEAVDRNRLTAAVRKALAAKPHFRSVPAVSDHRFYYRIREGEPDILEGVNRTVSLGREESRGFLFLVCMEDRRISFRVHHALVEARGWIDFVRTALAFYYGEDADPALDGGLVPFVEKHIDESRPFGKYKNPNIVNAPVLRAVSTYFNSSDIVFSSSDFSEIINAVKKGTFVYLDPPYDPVSDTSSFTGYSRGGFTRAQQIQLRECCDSLNERGIKFMLSNSATDFIREQYAAYHIKTVQAKRAINSVATRRGDVDEVIITNYD